MKIVNFHIVSKPPKSNLIYSIQIKSTIQHYVCKSLLIQMYQYLTLLGGDEPILSYEAVVQQECK